mgnify:CR=1 FL=1
MGTRPKREKIRVKINIFKEGKGRKKMKKAFKEVVKWIVRGAIYIWCRIYYRAEINGLENIPKEGPLIFCGNHRTYLDPPLMVVTAKRDMRFLAKEELYKSKFLSFLGWVFEAIPVKRDEKDICFDFILTIFLTE